MENKELEWEIVENEEYVFVELDIKNKYGIRHILCKNKNKIGYKRNKGVTYTIMFSREKCFFCKKRIPEYIQFQRDLMNGKKFSPPLLF